MLTENLLNKTMANLDHCRHTLSAVRGADSSCQFFVGRTQVICALYGPTEDKQRQSDKGFMSFDVTIRSAVGLSVSSDKFLEVALIAMAKRLLDCSAHPLLQLVVVIDLISDDGSLVAAMFNSFVLAAADLGLPLRCTALAVACASGLDLVEVFPNKKSESEALLTATQLVSITTGKVLYSIQSRPCFYSLLNVMVGVMRQAVDALRCSILAEFSTVQVTQPASG